jgi:solute carrier family 25 carnitine/acylcarnitine transporter 20/29
MTTTTTNATISNPTNPTTSSSAWTIGRSILQQEGIKGLYRGGLPVLLGGGLMRSAQFGVYSNTLAFIQSHDMDKDMDKDTRDKNRLLFGILDPYVVIAGFAGGIGRGLIEAPIEFIKIRRQVDHSWKLSEVAKGFSATLIRNSFLFSSFVVYMDLLKQCVGDVGAFANGAICASLAWATIWPMDVAKSQLQSGNYEGKTFRRLLVDVVRNGTIFRGIGPGITRSAIANGISMVVYRKVEHVFKASTAR